VAKLQWRDTPASASFTVRLRVRAQAQFAGGVIESVWSFIDAGERVDLALDPVVIEGAPDRLTGAAPTPTGETRISARVPAPIRVRRTIQAEGPDVATVRLTVTGHPQGAFLKLDETIPADCLVETDRLSGATASWVDGVLKFVWFDSPRNDTFEVTYRILGPRPRWENALQGTFTYLLNNVAQIGQTNATSPAAPAPSSAPALASAAPAPPAPKTSAAPAPKAAPTPKAAPAPKAAPTPKAAQPPRDVQGVAYRVQVLAGHRQVGPAYFAQYFDYRDRVESETHEGWIKYTTGSHGAYASARDARETLRTQHPFPGPFVTAYLDGERITVQEALTRSAQRWIP
jgi:cell division septation protein DedD